MVGKVGGDLAHAAGVAGGANATALARERDQPFVATVLTASPSEAVGQDAALEVAPEVALDPLGHAKAHGVGSGLPSQKGLEVVLGDLV